MAQKQSKEYVKGRLQKLKQNPEDNARLIKKWERKLRKYEVSVS